MQRFRAASFAATMTSLANAAMALNWANHSKLPADDLADRNLVQEALREAAPSMEELPLSGVIRSQFERLVKASKQASGVELAILIRELHNNIIVELSSAWFLMIPAERREQFEQRAPAFGEKVASKFVDATNDISSASRCLALEEWTACVFHLMRALEHALRALAANVGLPPDAMAIENWRTVIDRIEKEIRAMEALPKTPDKIERIQFLSSAAIQFRYFKDAWRNHVSHSRVYYERAQAEPIWLHVREFMQHLAEGL